MMVVVGTVSLIVRHQPAATPVISWRYIGRLCGTRRFVEIGTLMKVFRHLTILQPIVVDIRVTSVHAVGARRGAPRLQPG